MLITIMRDSKVYYSKPKDFGAIKSRLAKNCSRDAIITESVEEVAKDLTSRKLTISPAVCPANAEAEKGRGTRAADFVSQQLFMIDIDNDEEIKDSDGNIYKQRFAVPLTVETAIEGLAEKGIPVAFAYETFSSKPDYPKFRIALVSDEVFTDKAERDAVQLALIKLFLPYADKLCTNADRIFLPTDKGIYYENYEAICAKTALMALVDSMLSADEIKGTQQEAKNDESAQSTPSISATDSAKTSSKSDKSTDETKTEAEKRKLLEDIGKTIGEGDRNTKLKEFATAILNAYGDTALTHSVYLMRAKDCVPTLEEKEIKTIWNGSRKHFREKIETDPKWTPPEGYHKPNHYTRLYQNFKGSHQYVIATERTDNGEENDTMYVYENGVYRPKAESELVHELSKGVNMIPDPQQTRKAQQVIMATGDRVNINSFNADEDLVCFRNGIYRLSDGAVLPHDPSLHFTLQLNACIPNQILPTPYWDMCLQNLGDASVQRLIYELCGAVLSNVRLYRYKKAVLMFGVGDSGKSQVKEVLQLILGEGNYNNVDLATLESNRFSSSAFQRVRMGGTNELSHMKMAELKKFKLLTGGDSIEAERKHKNAFSFRFNGLLWFLSNQLPLFGGDKGEHVYNRWILLECKNSIPEKKKVKDLAAHMFNERDSFCMKALQAFKETIDNNYTFSIPESCKVSREEYQTRNSPLRMFISECCEKFDTHKHNPGNHSAKALWIAFSNWCEQGKYHVPNRSEFRKELAEICGVRESEVMQKKRTDCGVDWFYPYVFIGENYIDDDSLNCFGYPAVDATE